MRRRRYSTRSPTFPIIIHTSGGQDFFEVLVGAFSEAIEKQADMFIQKMKSISDAWL